MLISNMPGARNNGEDKEKCLIKQCQYEISGLISGGSSEGDVCVLFNLFY